MKASDNVFPKVLFAEGTAPATPAAGTVAIYAKTDGLLYAKDDAGTETALGGGALAFTDLTDVPSSYTGQAGLYAKVNAGETGLEFDAPAGSGDVVGPASSVDSHVALFDGTTGKLLKDGGALGGMAGINDAPSDGTGYVRKDGAWVAESGGGGSDDLTIITEASAVTMVPATHSGRSKLILAGGDVTFNSTESYAAGNVFNIRATGAVTLVGTGVTLAAPSGGTLSLSADMTVTVAMTSSTAGAVIGQTVAA